MLKLLFGQSYYLHFDPKLWKAMQPYPPLGTLYAASYLRARGAEVALFDAMLAASEAEWDASLAHHTPDVAVIYEDNFNYLSKMCLLRMREAAFNMIRMAKRRGCIVVAAGSDATDHASLYLEQGVDFALLGEGEDTLAELVDHLAAASERPFHEIPRLAYLDRGSVCASPRRPPLRDLDSLPYPAWDLVDVEQYRRLWLQHHGYYSMNMITTRGCPYHCNWCAKPIWGQRYNSRSPENVAAELKWLKETYQPDHIWFADDIMGLQPGWWQRFADLVEAHDARVPFKCLSRADLIGRTPEDVNALQRSGCQVVWIGAESGSQKILDAMEKGTTIQQIHTAADLLHQAGIQVGFFLQFGYPGETRADIEQTLQMVRTAMPDDIGMSVSYPLPGTKFYESVKRQLGEKQNWTDSADLAMMVRGPFSTAFYRQLHIVLHAEFRARRAWRSLRPVITRPRLWRPRHLRDAAAIIYRLLALPLARLRLSLLARRTPGAVLPPVHMSLEEAAHPSAQ